MSPRHQRADSTMPAPGSAGAARSAYARLSRNFWGLVAAAVTATGVLSAALRMPSGAAAGTLTALSGVAALAALALAGRMLVVVTGAVGKDRPSGTRVRRG